MPVERVDLVIPVYNESAVLENSVQRLTAALHDGVDFRWQIVIVDNASVDGTHLVGKKLAANLPFVRFLHLDRKGRGGALRHTWMQTDADFSLYMDVDLSTDLEAVLRTVAHLRAGADIVTGSRIHPQSQVKRCLKREILSQGYIRLIKLVMGTLSFDDAQCGFKGIRVKRVRPLLSLVKNQNWFFDTELLVLAEYSGMRVKTIPINWHEDSDSRVNIPRTIYEDLKGIARLRWTARKLVKDWLDRSEGAADQTSCVAGFPTDSCIAGEGRDPAS